MKHLHSASKAPEVVSHPWEHLSDILAGYVIRRYGGGKYGSSAAPAVGMRTVFVGRGGYDEHRDPTLAGECEATLAANDLGVGRERGLAPLLRYTRLVDTAGFGKGFAMLGRVVELLPRVHQDRTWRTRQWAELFFDAFIAVHQRRMDYQAMYPDTRREVRRAIKRAFELAARRPNQLADAERFARSKLRRLFFAEARLPFPAFTLPYCAEVILLHLMHRFRHNRRGRDIAWRAVVEWLADGIRAEIMRQAVFLKAGSALRGAEEISVFIDGEEFFLMFVESDEEAVHSRLFRDSQWIPMVVLRRSPRGDFGHTRGQVRVLTRRSNLPSGFIQRFDDFVALVRVAEQELRGKPKSAWPELVAQSEPPGAEAWFYHYGLRALFNGARSAPNVEPTLISNEQLVACMRHAFDDEHWQRRNEFRIARGGEFLPMPKFREERADPEGDDTEDIEGEG